MEKEFDLSKEQQATEQEANSEFMIEISKRFLRSKSYPKTNPYWRAILKFHKKKLI